MDIALKLVIAASLLGMLRSSERFREMSREVDESVILALKRFMLAAEESGFPPEIVPLLMILTVVTFMFMVVTAAGGRQ